MHPDDGRGSAGRGDEGLDVLGRVAGEVMHDDLLVQPAPPQDGNGLDQVRDAGRAEGNAVEAEIEARRLRRARRRETEDEARRREMEVAPAGLPESVEVVASDVSHPADRAGDVIVAQDHGEANGPGTAASARRSAARSRGSGPSGSTRLARSRAGQAKSSWVFQNAEGRRGTMFRWMP